MFIKKVTHICTLTCFLSTTLVAINTNENIYYTKRVGVVQSNLAALGNEELATTFPHIGFCFSGGGERAMVSSLGFMLGAEATGLLGTCLYVSALSGSTWMLGNYYARQKSLAEVKAILRTNLQKDFFGDFFSTIKQLAKKLETHYTRTRELQMADLWGGLIAKQTFADVEADAQTIPFSALIPAAETIGAHSDFIQNYPFPIFNAVHPVVNHCCSCCWAPCQKIHYTWFEITPYHMREVFSSNTCMLKDIELVEPEEQSFPLTLAYMMGVCGSAYSVSANDITTFFKESIQSFFTNKLSRFYEEDAESRTPGRDRGILLQEMLASIRLGRLAPARIPFAGEELTFVDAGLCDNLPLQPLLERNMNVIFICDASSNAYSRRFPELKKAAAIEHAHGRPFPSLRNGKIMSDEIIVFEDEIDPSLPTLVYFHNPVEFDTTKMSYTADEFDTLCFYMENAVMKNTAVIEKIIFDKAERLAMQED